jgi:hypothetical protein
MKPRHGSEQEEFRGASLDAASSQRSGAATAPGAEPGDRTALVESKTATTDLVAWLDALESNEPEWADERTSDESFAATHGREAQELLLALATVEPQRPSLAPSAARRSRPSGRVPSRHFDARVLAERLLADTQRSAVLGADPEELFAAQVSADAFSHDVLERLLGGLAGYPHGDDEGAFTGPTERGLLALLALQLYVHEASRRPRSPSVEHEPQTDVTTPVVHDMRLLESLAVPHEASRPLGERRPRGRPRH